MTNQLTQSGARLLRSAVEIFRDWQQRDALRREFHSLGAVEGERVLHDCGMSRSEILSALQRCRATEDLLSPAMRALGLDPVTIKRKHPGWSRDIERACTSCLYRRRCRGDLSARRFATSHHDYCVNSDSFSEMDESGIAA